VTKPCKKVPVYTVILIIMLLSGNTFFLCLHSGTRTFLQLWCRLQGTYLLLRITIDVLSIFGKCPLSLANVSWCLEYLVKAYVTAYVLKQNTVIPHIVSSLEYFPPLNSSLTSVRKLLKFLLHKGKINEATIWKF
jgi:hypothetical protein